MTLTSDHDSVTVAEEESAVSRIDLDSRHMPMTSGEEVLYNLLFNDNSSSQSSSSGLSSHYYSGSEQQQYQRHHSYQQQQQQHHHQQQQQLQLQPTTSLDESLAYLQELNGMHVERLQSEPARLADSQQHIQEEIKNLAFSNYKTFIRTAQCSREIYADFSVIEAKLDQLIGRLPAFGALCDHFSRSIQSINGGRRANNLTLQKHNQLLEILEISQLMDTCVRNEYYDEALELAAYVRRLEKKLAASIPLVQQIVDDVARSLALMQRQLLGQLRTSLQFNQCLKVIGLIRHLDVYSECELRIKFLQLRDAWLQSLLAAIPHADSYHHISKTIEINRIHLFDIITQYRAIFSDEDLLAGSTTSSSSSAVGDSSLSSSSAASTTTSATTLLLLQHSAQQRDASEARLFFCWLQQKIQCFLGVLAKDLRGVGSRLDSVLSQAMYFGLAFSRVGLDFRALMVPVFEQAVLDQVDVALRAAARKFDDALRKLNWSELSLEMGKLTSWHQHSAQSSSTATHATTAATATAAATTAASSGVVSPPIELLDFQPLGVYANALLQCFNELRLCAPLSVCARVAALVRGSLRDIGALAAAYYAGEKAALDKSEQALFASFVGQLAHCLVPFVERCLAVLFPVEQLQRNLAVPQLDAEKLRTALRLDSRQLLASLADLIPEETPSIAAVEEAVTVAPTATTDNELALTETSQEVNTSSEQNRIVSDELEVASQVLQQLDRQDDNGTTSTTSAQQGERAETAVDGLQTAALKETTQVDS